MFRAIQSRSNAANTFAPQLEFFSVQLINSLKPEPSFPPSASPSPLSFILGGVLQRSDGKPHERHVLSVSTPRSSSHCFGGFADESPESPSTESSPGLSKYQVSSSHILSITRTSPDPQSMPRLKRISMVFSRDFRADPPDENRFQTESVMLLTKCAWFDTALERWATSGCSTKAISPSDYEPVLCECSHLTEFAVLMFSGSDTNFTSSFATSSHSAAERILQYQASLIALFAMAAIGTLFNSIYGGRLLRPASSLHTRRSFSVMNALLMLTTYSQIAFLLCDMMGIPSSTTFYFAPLLIGLRFMLFTFFTSLVMKPLVEIKKMSNKKVSAFLKTAQTWMSFMDIMFVVAISVLVYTKQGKLASYSGIDSKCTQTGANPSPDGNEETTTCTRTTTQHGHYWKMNTFSAINTMQSEF